jgi:membrane-associated phospholipid phosphatase
VAGLAVAAITGTARMYVGAHLPLDVVGGYAIGALCGQLTNAAVDRGRHEGS